MPSYIQMEAGYSHCLSTGDVSPLVIDEDHFVGG